MNIINYSFEIKSNGSKINHDSFIIYTDGACKNNGSKNLWNRLPLKEKK